MQKRRVNAQKISGNPSPLYTLLLNLKQFRKHHWNVTETGPAFSNMHNVSFILKIMIVYQIITLLSCRMRLITQTIKTNTRRRELDVRQCFTRIHLHLKYQNNEDV